jgi:DNA polymerase-3 subunit gamma/tau
VADQALYRKYRSAKFSEVVGQDHIVKTLQAALEAGRHVHAYLFTGPRGVGKTSVARLLARALTSSTLDIIEIDGASNRSIDAVRDLREKVNIAPTQGKYKVYIIDEVHMLTTEAFNALLKTLEEPPAHAVFIMATTEAHKVPETIISRTQRFSFRPIPVTELSAGLTRIAEQEKLQAAPEAIGIIANAARGSFRDGISLLDQVASGGGEITPESVRALLGYTTSETVAALSRALVASDSRAALQVTTQFAQQGAQASQVALQLAEFWRQVLLAAAGGPPATTPEAAELATRVPAARAAQVVDELLEVSRSQWPALALESALVKLTTNASQPTPTPSKPSQTGPTVVPSQPVNAAHVKNSTDDKRRERSREEESAGTAQPSATNEGTLDAALWPKVIVLVKSKNNSLAALLQMYPVDFTATEITVKPRFNFHRDIFNKHPNRTLLEQAAAKVYGTTVRVNAHTDDATASGRRGRTDANTELLSSALEILGGEVVE